MALKVQGKKEVGTLRLTNSTKLEFSLVKHDDKVFVDIRTWFSNQYQNGVWTPTKKGIHFPLVQLDNVIALLQTMKQYEEKDLEKLDESHN